MNAQRADDLRGPTFIAAQNEDEVRELESLGGVLIYRSPPGAAFKLTLRWCGEGEPRFK